MRKRPMFGQPWQAVYSIFHIKKGAKSEVKGFEGAFDLLVAPIFMEYIKK